MRNKHLQMKLSPDEKNFLRHWIYDEMHFRDGAGPAKRLQVAHQVAPFNLAAVIAAALPEIEQMAAAEGPPPVEPPTWPWTDDDIEQRIIEARSLLAERELDGAEDDIEISNQEEFESAVRRLHRSEQALKWLRPSEVNNFDYLTKSYSELIEKLTCAIETYSRTHIPAIDAPHVEQLSHL